MYSKINSRGAITVEAAIALPVFICVVMSLAMLVKLVYIHDLMQHSIDEAANELAAYSYVYYASDLQQVDESIQDVIDENAEQAEEHYGILINAMDTLEGAFEAGSGFFEGIDSAASSEEDFIKKAESIINQAGNFLVEGQQLSQQGIESINQLQKAFEEVCKNPQEEAESIAWLLSKGIYSDAKTLVAVPLIKHTVKKHFENEGADADERLRKLNISKGFEGLDFYSSRIFDGNEDIDIVVKYKVDLPLPIKILPDIHMVQRSTARAWLNGGDGSSLAKTSIWDLPNKQRGMKIEELYGGNLPYDFPVIDIYDSSTKTGTSIKSINLNSKTYQNANNLYKKLKQYVDDLRQCGVIRYKGTDYIIANKKLVIVIPKGSVNENNNGVLEEIKSYAQGSGIDITISQLE